MPTKTEDRALKVAVLVAALGYFVDVYDLLLFNIVRVQSLTDLGYSGDALLENGVFLLNVQMIGMLLGGIFWGILGDKRGRLSVLFGSIILYSLANIANAFVTSIEMYAVLRFLAGIGLAGELGAGITLVSEMMPKQTRGYATTIVATVGVCGGLAAAAVGDLTDWRTSYLIGGIMGLVLLFLRIAVHESGMFSALKEQAVSRGNLLLIFTDPKRLTRYAMCILIGVPIWFVVGVIVTFSPEIGKALGITEPIKNSSATLYYSIGIVLGDIGSGLLSQFMKSRKKAIFVFVLGTLVFTIAILTNKGVTASQFYTMLIPLGFFIGYWAVFVTSAAEQFGTNLRATVATTVPNFVRGSAALMTYLFKELNPSVGAVQAAGYVGAIAFSLAFIALFAMRETFGRDLNFLELDGKGLPEAEEERKRAVANA